MIRASGSFAACTIIARNYIAHARVLAESIAAHHPGEKLAVLVVDAHAGSVAPESDHIELLEPADIGFTPGPYRRLAAIYDARELSTAVKPQLLRHMLDSGREAVAFFDPDIALFEPLSDLAELGRSHGIVLTPHTMAPVPRDGLKPSDREILSAGVYNLGFIAVGQRARPFLDWWDERLRRDCLVAVEQGLFVDQRWVDFVPSLFPHLILRDETVNVAYWNLHGRMLTWDGGYRVNGEPLRFFHFSGFDPRHPHVFTSHWPPRHTLPRISLGGSAALARLCREYGEQLVAHGYLECIRTPYGFARAADGRMLDVQTRRRWREDLLSFEEGIGPEPPDPFDPGSFAAFERWHEDAVGGASAVERAAKVVSAGPPIIGDSRRGRLGNAYRRLVLTALRHYRHYQDEIASALVQEAQQQRHALRELRQRLDRELESVPYMSDPLTLKTTNAEGVETIGFRSECENAQRGGFYIGFEETFRGPEELITERQRAYVPLLAGSELVVDLGCGRGEFLDLMAEAGVPARGVDMNPDMVDRCKEKGHDVEKGDAIDFLAAQADHSLGALFSAQVVEHLEFDRLLQLLSLAVRKLHPGGQLVAETVNPHSLPAFRTFWVDPTHIGPLFPETLVALCRELGFGEATVMFPQGEGDLEYDRRHAGEYAVIARTRTSG